MNLKSFYSFFLNILDNFFPICFITLDLLGDNLLLFSCVLSDKLLLLSCIISDELLFSFINTGKESLV
jgi:hypothetical protein